MIGAFRRFAWRSAAGVGALAEFALRNERLSFDQLLYFDPARWSPGERLRIVSIVGYIFAFFLGVNAVQVGLGTILLNDFIGPKPYCSLAIGFITGFAFPYVREILFQLRPVVRAEQQK